MIDDKKQYVPSFATLGNLCAGVFSCALAVEGAPGLSALLIVLAVLFDSVDGALARKLGVTSDFGGQLDSLADMVSFGVAPALLVGVMLPEELKLLGWGLVLVFPMCSAWRLARFNVRQVSDGPHGDFTGLPTTGAGGAVAALVLVCLSLSEGGINLGLHLLPWLLLVLSFLMVSQFPYKHVGTVLALLPLPLKLLWSALLILAAVVWRYELVLTVVFWSYVFSGPAILMREKIIPSHQAQP